VVKSFLLIIGLCASCLAQTPAAKPQPGTLPGTQLGTTAPYQPITGSQRGVWFVKSTLGPTSLLGAGLISAGWGTLRNSPEEYGPHWEGFGKRYGMRLTGVTVGNAMEAGLGAMWGEDPRYFRSPDPAFGARVRHVVRTTFTAPGRDGKHRFAYARVAGNVGNNFLSNLWREPSESSASEAAWRCLWGVTGRMSAHAFAEFWPDVKKKVLKK
jgi:hypothetical protein